MERHPSAGALLALLLSAAMLSAWAQDSAEAQKAEATELAPVIVTGAVESPYAVEDSAAATKLPLSLRETPQSVTVITRQRLDDQNLNSLREVLDNTPGVYSRAWDTERVIFSARGFDIDSLMYDGVPVEKNFSFSTGSIDDTIDTALYERIEIVRGATGLMTGAGSPAASVNVVRKRADSKTLAAQLELTTARWNDQRVEADISTPLNRSGSVRARGVGVYQSRESYQDLYSNEKQVFYGVVDADLTPSTWLSVGYEYQDNQPQSNTWGSFPLFLSDGREANWPRSVTTATDWSFWNRRRQAAFGELRQAFGDGWMLRSSLTWRRYNEDLALFYMYGFPDPDTGEGLAPFAYRSNADITEKVLDLYVTGPFKLFGREHELVAGYTGSTATNVGHEYPAPPSEELPDTGNFFEWDGSYPEPVFEPGILLNDIDTRQHGIYVAGRFVLADPLKLIAGARYATWKTDHFYLYDSPDVGFHHDYGKAIPYAGLIWDLSAEFSAFASYTQIFEPQNARAVDGSYLDPVEGRSYEAGIKGEHFDGRLNTALTLFETLQDNVSEALYDPETGDEIWVDGFDHILQASRAIDGTRTRGFELEASGELSKGWNASLGWSRYLLEDADGNPVRTFVPRTLVRFFTAWTPGGALSKLTVGGGVNWQSESYNPVGLPGGLTTLRQGEFTLLSLLARYQFTPNVSVQVNGSNLLDKTYYVVDEYDNTCYGAPISYAASLNLRF
jgi:outer membrane receptor for ferric coprogen and ferric-rhodotorulic acid